MGSGGISSPTVRESAGWQAEKDGRCCQPATGDSGTIGSIRSSMTRPAHERLPAVPEICQELRHASPHHASRHHLRQRVSPARLCGDARCCLAARTTGASWHARGQGFKCPQLHPMEVTEMVDTLVSNQRGDRMSEPPARGVTSYRGRRRAWMTACSHAAFMMPLPGPCIGASGPAQPGAGPTACLGVSFFGSMKGFSTTTARTRSVGVSTSSVVPRSVRPIGSIA
jgi:hypothetical protein